MEGAFFQYAWGAFGYFHQWTDRLEEGHLQEGVVSNAALRDLEEVAFQCRRQQAPALQEVYAATFEFELGAALQKLQGELSMHHHDFLSNED